MKKRLLLVFVLILLGSVVEGGIYWIPSEEENYHFNQPIIAGEVFNLYMNQTYSVFDNRRPESWGRYGDNWALLDPCEGGPDGNLFRAPVGTGTCTLINYDATNTYSASVTPHKSFHEVSMDLNCTVGDYGIRTRYAICWPDGTVINYVCGPYWWTIPCPTLTFKVLPDIDMPPFYDYNMFWSTVGDTNRHYIHAYDINEMLDGNYFIKEFEVKVDPDCEVMGGGAKNLDKSAEVGDWYTTIYSSQHKKFSLLKKKEVFQEGLTCSDCCEDTYIRSNSSYNNNNYGDAISTKVIGPDSWDYYSTLIRFKNLGIPLGSIIESAALDMNSFYIGYDNTNLLIYPIWKYDWNEMQATWNQWKTDYNWTTPGAGETDDSGPYNDFNGTGPDRTLTPEDTVNLNTTNENMFWSQFGPAADVTESLQHQLDYNKWGGWLIKSPDGEEAHVYMRSCDTPTEANRPKLRVLWEEPPSSVDAADYNNLNLYVDVKCNSWGFKDFNITITDADNHSIDLNTAILDINAYKLEGSDINPNKGPPGVNAGGPYIIGNNGFVLGEAYGVIDYETDTNHLIVDANSYWKLCKPGFGWQCLADAPLSQDENCIITDNYTAHDGEVILTNDYNLVLGGGTAGGIIQYITNQEGISCTTPGFREGMFFVKSEADDKIYLDVVNIYVPDIRADLNEPYYIVVNEDNEITGLAIDNDSIVDINTARWHVYAADCGPKTGWTLDNQTSTPTGTDKNVTTTATIKCNTTGVKAANFFITTKKQDTGESLPTANFRGDTKLHVILPDSLRMDSFEVVPPKARKGTDVSFNAVVKSKLNSPVNPVDLNVEVQFEVFDEKGVLIDVVVAESQLIPEGKQKTFSYSYATTDLEENSPYRVTAMAYLVSGSGPLLDRQAVNDVLEDYFWVLPADDKLEKLPEINYLTVMLVLVLVLLIFQGKD